MNTHLPSIIQGGMGAAVSDWRLANAVARRGQLGVVSGTGLDQILARRLQRGDADGSLRRAIYHFPCSETARHALADYFIEGGISDHKRFRSPLMFRIDSPREHLAFAVLAAFAEVWLAKENHRGPVGINLLEKIALPNPAMLYGAMLAGVDYVLMGAGIPWQIPGILDSFVNHERIAMKLALEDDALGAGADVVFDPKDVIRVPLPPLDRPKFLAIVASATLAQALLKRATGAIDGFVVEGPTAGGHNAPPRGIPHKNERGEPIYGERDVVDLEKMRALGLPFWLAGGQAMPDSLARARYSGAVGIQVGTLFAFCEESGLAPELRKQVLECVREGTADVFTDPSASPTGFPFKVVRLPGTLSEQEVYEQRERVCDAGYLRRVYRKPDGGVGYRCPGEPLDDFIAKGGDAEESAGRKCLCNSLIANVGLPQQRKGGAVERALVTAGDDLVRLGDIMGAKLMSYTAADALQYLLAGDAR
jgi:nitronate monooxygenase